MLYAFTSSQQNQMFRPAPWQEAQTEQAQIKMQMLQSNIIRVISQNKKLQHLLDYREYFPRLKEHIMQVSSNWTRINALIRNINDLDVEMKSEREAMHSNVNHYYEHINKNIVDQIKNYKISITNHREKIAQMKNRQKIRIRKNFEKLKVKWSNHVKHVESQIMDILIKTEKTFLQSIDNASVPRIAQKVEEQFYSSDVNCRLELGHVQNLLSFYTTLNNNKKEPCQQSNQEKSECDILAIRTKTQQVIGLNIELMEQAIKQMDFKLKGVSSQVNWLQKKRKKPKIITTKPTEQSHLNHEEFTESFKLIQLKIELEDVESQLMGLGKFYDEMVLQRKMQGYAKNQSQGQNLEQPLISERQQRRMISIKQRLAETRPKIVYYDQFYKNFNL